MRGASNRSCVAAIHVAAIHGVSMKLYCKGAPPAALCAATHLAEMTYLADVNYLAEVK
jgi:hypothetical protein